MIGLLKALPWAETFTALSATAGYFLVVWGVAALLTPWAWAFGTGIYLMALSGFRLLGVIAWAGLYALMQDENGEEDRGS